MTKENKERIGFTKDQMIQFLKIFQHNTDTMLDMEEQNYENNKKYMKMEQMLFHEQWKCRYLVRRINIASRCSRFSCHRGEEIKGSEN